MVGTSAGAGKAVPDTERPRAAKERERERVITWARQGRITEEELDAQLLQLRGELAALYRQATLVFVGGSLVPIGGHSPLEPALSGKAMVFGPHMDHFAEVAELLVSQGAAIQIQDGAEMAVPFARLLKDRAQLQRMGRAAEQIVRANQGTVAKDADLLTPLLRRH